MIKSPFTSLIFTAYANIDNANSSANINNQAGRCDLYYKNIIVALISAKINNPYCDVALITNRRVPENFYKLLEQNNILILHFAFDNFKFDNDYPWSLAFYKLCALKKVLDLEYCNYLMLDSDVFVQNNLSMLWNWTSDYLVMFDTSETTERWQNEMHAFLQNETYITHWGGEFIAGSKEILKKFIDKCERVYDNMQRKNFTTIHGDEFIESVALNSGDFKIKHAGLFMYRFWTRTDFRVQTVLPKGGISVLHVPAEKEFGMIKIFKYIVSKHRLPSQRKAQKLLHINAPALTVRIKKALKWLKNNYCLKTR